MSPSLHTAASLETSDPVPSPVGMLQTARDYAALTKPRITVMVVLTAASGMWLSSNRMAWSEVIVALGSIALIVGAANTFNCWIERDSDRLMARTRKRPLPDQRLKPRPAFWFGLVLALVAVPLMAWAVNPLTAILAAGSTLIYVVAYTPMKRMTPIALVVGAIPGAIPPLLGWTAATGEIGAPGLILFGILFIWQIPHFIAISIFRQKEYAKAGLKVLPELHGRKFSLGYAIVWAASLIPLSMMLPLTGTVGVVYSVVALVGGLAYLGATVRAFLDSDNIKRARQLFVVSLLYLPAVFAVVVLR